MAAVGLDWDWGGYCRPVRWGGWRVPRWRGLHSPANERRAVESPPALYTGCALPQPPQGSEQICQQREPSRW